MQVDETRSELQFQVGDNHCILSLFLKIMYSVVYKWLLSSVITATRALGVSLLNHHSIKPNVYIVTTGATRTRNV